MIVVLGAGESGVGSALLATKHNIKVFVSDSGTIKDKYRKILEQNNIEFEQGQHSEDIILQASEIIKSPGISDTVPIIQKAKQKNIPVISEIEFAARYTDGTFIAITGSNGKTTTTTLIWEILKNAGYDAALTGNVGTSLAGTIAQRDYQYYVLEISSFQLDNCYRFNPHIAILLNITPDHLDRYGNNFDNYVKSKFRIVQNHTPEDIFIYWAEDNVITSYLRQNPVSSEKIAFAWHKNPSVRAYVENGKIFVKVKARELSMDIDRMAIRGKHNVYNAMAAAAAAMILDVPPSTIIKTLEEFKGVEHRLEKVDVINGITFINDSKATNVTSVWYALESVSSPVILILGGIDKGNDYSALFPLVKEKVKSIIALGKDNSKIINNFQKLVPVYNTASMQQAVDKAYQLAEQGDTVLLSPACASFDLFDNYIHRGKEFKQAVSNLKKTSSK